MEGIEKYYNGYKVNGFSVFKSSQLWRHTVDRIKGFEKKCKTPEEFQKKMVTRLKRITHKEKIYYTIAVLVELGYKEVAEIYDGRLVMESLADDLDFLDEL